MRIKRHLTGIVAPVALALLMAACSPRSAPTQPTSAPATAAATTAATAAATAAATEQAASTATSAPAQEPTLIPTLTPPSAATSAPPTADDLARVKAAGKLLVGLSADYPPYEFYNTQFKIDGFDVALINDLAKRVGVTTEINDFAFEGLLAALQLGQVDAVISAVSVTPERQELADFTNVYFIGADALLARSDYPADQVKTLAEVAGRKIGTQTGTVYASYLKRELVDKGLTNANDLFLYSDTASAIKDLQAKRVDVVMMDRLPANTFASTAGLKVIGENFNPQRFAMAVRKGSDLRKALNDALLSAQNDGTVTNLIGSYLNLKPSDVEPVPTPTPGVQPAVPQPTATAGPPPCVAGMSFVGDLNYNDQNMTAPPVFQPGTPFTKGWRVRNSGNCNWAADYTLRFVFGNVPAAQMGGTAVAVGQAIAPGATADLYVNLVAPNQPGTYQGFWQMYDSSSTPFGERAWVGIIVPAAATATPPPQQPTPVPGISFSANPATINQGQCTLLSWNVQGVNGVWFYPQGQPYQNYGVGGVSNSQQCPQQTTTYELRVQFNDGTVRTQDITIYVNPASGSGPVITSFNAQPGAINPGGCVSLSWSITGVTTRVAITRNGAAIYDGAPVVGATSDCPPNLPGQTIVTYALQAFDTNNQVVQTTRQVTIAGGGGLPPSGGPTPAP